MYKKSTLYFLMLSMLSILATSCVDESMRPLPILGNRDFVNGDTVYQTIPAFSFVNQDSVTVTEADYKGKVYVVDFFFTHCSTICPKVTKQMLRVYNEYKTDSNVMLLSHTIDVKHDTIGRLRAYAKGINVEAPKWNFVTGDKGKIYGIANFYFSVAKEDPNTPDGFDHSGRLILIDSKRQVRAFCDGTNPEEVDGFMKNIQKLLEEEKGLKK
jgi:protein SCO1